MRRDDSANAGGECHNAVLAGVARALRSASRRARASHETGVKDHKLLSEHAHNGYAFSRVLAQNPPEQSLLTSESLIARAGHARRL